MVVFTVGHVCQRVHERHRAVIVLEAIGLCQRVAVLGQLPARDLWQQFLDAGLGELVLAALARHAMGLGEGDQIGHVGSCRKSEEHTSELQSLMRISYAVFCLKKKTQNQAQTNISSLTNI